MRFFSSPLHPDRFWGPVQWIQEAKRKGREVDHSTPSSAKVKNVWSYTSILPLRIHGVVLS